MAVMDYQKKFINSFLNQYLYHTRYCILETDWNTNEEME